MEYPFCAPTELCPEATPENLSPHTLWLEPHALCPETGRFILAFQSYLVQTSHHTILIDTFVGCDKTETQCPEWGSRQDHA